MNGLTKDSFLRLAREAGLPVSDKFDGIGYVWCSDEYPIDEQLQRFANLVAAAEREACAKVCEQRAADHEEDSRFEDDPDYKERFLVYAKHERRCAKEIRARGNNAA